MKEIKENSSIAKIKRTAAWCAKTIITGLMYQSRIAKLSMLIFAAVAVYFCIFQYQNARRIDSSGPEITMDADTITVSVKDDEQALLQGITAQDRKDGDVTDSIVVENLSALVGNGKRTATYAAFDSDNHVTRESRNVVYEDYTRPVFKLSAPLQFPVNTTEILGSLRAVDCIDGDITSTVKFLPQGEFSTETAGTYQVEFRAVNSAGDVAILNAPIRIYEPGSNQGPEITLTEYLVYLEQGDSFDPVDYLDTIKLNRVYDIVEGEGNYDRDPQPEDERIVVGSDYIDIDNTVDTDIPGNYTVTYSRTEDAGNQDTETGSVQLIVIVAQED